MYHLFLASALLCGLMACGPKAADADATTMGSGTSSTGDTSTSSSTSSSTGVLPTSTTTGDPCGTAGCGADASSSGTGCSFVGCNTDSDTGTSVSCDPFAQDCPDGQKCAPVTGGWPAWNETRCVPVTGDGQPGDDCVAESVADGLDDCAKGVMCWGVDDKGNGECVEQCSGAAEAPFCPNMGWCTMDAEGVIALCFPACSPLLQDCDAGEACYLSDNFVCAPDGSGDEGQANDPCEFVTDCDPGLLCGVSAFVGAGCPQGSMGCCTPFCDLSKPVCPNPDQQCVAWFDPMNIPPVPPDAANIGACGLPI